MDIKTLITLIEAGLRLGLSAAEIVKRLCIEGGGQAIPTLEEFEAHIEKVRDLPDLKPKSE